MKIPKKQSFLRSTFVLALSLVTVKIIGAFFKIPLMNLLGETGMGYFSAAYTVFTAVYAVTVSGLSSAFAKLTAEYADESMYPESIRLRRITLPVYGCIGLLGTLVMLFGANTFAARIQNPLSAPSVAAIAFAVFFCCLMAVYRGYYEGMGNMTPTAVSQVVEAFGKLFFGLAGVFFVLSDAKKRFLQGRPIFGTIAKSIQEAISAAMPYASAAALLGISAASFLGLIYLLLYRALTDHKCPTYQVPSKPLGTQLKKLFDAAVPITVSTVLLQLIPLIDTLTVIPQLKHYYIANPDLAFKIGTLLQAGETQENFMFGVYAACVTVYNLIPTAAALLSKSVLPRISALNACAERQTSANYIKAVTTAACYFTVPAGLGIAGIAETILAVLYARQPYTALYGTQSLMLLGVAAIFSGILMPFTAALQAGKSKLQQVFAQCIGAAVKLICNLCLIQRFGIAGASISTVLTQFVMAVTVMVGVRKQYGKIKLAGVLCKLIPMSLLSTAIAAWAGEFLRTILPYPTMILAGSITFAALSYLITTVLFQPIEKNTLNILSNGEKLRKGLEKFRIIR